MSSVTDEPLRPPPRLVVALLAIAFASVALVTWASGRHVARERIALEAAANRIAQTRMLDRAASELALPVALGDTETVAEIARQLIAEDRGPATIRVQLADGSTVASGSAQATGPTGVRELHAPIASPEHLFFAGRLASDLPTQVVGRVEIVLDDPAGLAGFAAPTDAVLPAALATVVVLALALALWLRHRILSVCHAAAALAAGRFVEVKAVGGSDELAWATRALADVAQLLAEQVERVHGRNAALVRDVALTEDRLDRQSGFAASLVAPLAEHALPEQALAALLEHAGASLALLFTPREDQGGRLACLAVAGAALEPSRVDPVIDPDLPACATPVVLPALSAAHPWMLASGRNVPLPGVVAVPLQYRGKCEGVAILADRQAWSAGDLAFFADVARPLAIALANRRAYEATLALAATLELRHDELLRQRDELAIVDRLRAQFVANMSHELRTPLNAIIGYTELVVDECYGPLTAPQREPLENVLEASNHLLSLVGHVLDLSRAQAGAIDLDIREFDLRAVVDDVARMASALCRDRPYVPRVRGATCQIVSDASRLRQILTNLVGNAIKFTAEGSVDIDIQHPDEATVQIVVSDTGPGIDPAHFELIFEEFRQADGSATRSHDGAGLGLAISRQLAHALGGSLSVASEHGGGSRFTLMLPRRSDAGATLSPPASLVSTPRQHAA